MGSEKTWEEKFEDYLKDNSMKRMYMVDYLKAGYDIAKEEEKAKIEKLKRLWSFMQTNVGFIQMRQALAI